MSKEIKNVIIWVIIFTIFVNIFVINSIGNDIDNWTNLEIVSFESKNSSYRAIIDVDENNITHIAWKDNSNIDNSGSDWNIFYKEKPYIENWIELEVITNEDTYDCSCLDLSVDILGTVHIVWAGKPDENTNNDNIYYRSKSINGGWSQIELVSFGNNKDCSCPALYVDKNCNVHIAWPDVTDYNNSGDDYDIFYRCKNFDGTWSPIELVSIFSSDDSLEVSISVDSKNLPHLVWEDKSDYNNSGDDYDIFYRCKNFDGTWSPIEIVSMESNEESLSPSIEIDEFDKIHVIWNERTDFDNSGKDYDIVYRNKKINGVWGDIEVVSTESNTNCKWPTSDIDVFNRVHVAWSDNIDSSKYGTDYDIFYKYRTEEGFWSPVEIVTKESITNSHWPSLATDENGNVYLSWWDENNGNWTVYFRQRYLMKGEIEQVNNSNKTYSLNFFIFVSIIGIIIAYKKFKNKGN